MSQRLEAEYFENRLGQTVHFHAETTQFEAEVSLVDRLEHASEGGREPFSVVFSTNHTDAYPQSIYRLKDPEHGEQLIFLVPIGPNENGMCYEAVFT